jgi:hypothetical protein
MSEIQGRRGSEMNIIHQKPYGLEKSKPIFSPAVTRSGDPSPLRSDTANDTGLGSRVGYGFDKNTTTWASIG